MKLKRAPLAYLALLSPDVGKGSDRDDARVEVNGRFRILTGRSPAVEGRTVSTMRIGPRAIPPRL